MDWLWDLAVGRGWRDLEETIGEVLKNKKVSKQMSHSARTSP